MADSPTETYVLEGRVVTMGPLGVIDDGAIYIDAGVIEAVSDADDPAPDAKYAGAPRIRTGDTIYPGLIELHNHLSYNAMPLWDVPKKYSNNGQWRGSDGYTREITKPSQVLGQTDGAAQALVRYVECRALLGGTTTTQGITLAKAGGIKKYYKGIVRNVEQPLNDGLPKAGTKIANPESGGAVKYLEHNLGNNTCYLQHLAEGTDDTARGWFLRLQIDQNTWAVNDVLCGIHSAALHPEDYQVLADGGASMVWSPLSNYLLYGATADFAAAKDAGVNIALGSDWAPSGSKNLLGELKVAWLASQREGDVFTEKELAEMVTVNAAAAVKWGHLLGSIEPGKLADVIAVNGRSDDAYEQLLRARETSVTLVVIDGVPRVGQKRLMRRFWDEKLDDVAAVEKFRISRTDRYLYLEHDDDLLGGISLDQAVADLADAMRNLPQLAVEVDNAVVTPITAAGGVAFAGGMTDASGEGWRIVPDFEDDDVATALEAAQGDVTALAAEPYSFWVSEPIELDPITVAQDPSHLRTLVAARNLPEFVKKGLPPLYGETIPIPDSASFLEDAGVDAADQLLDSTQSLSVFLRTFGELALGERRRIVDQAIVLLESNYVHLPLKRSMHAVDPVQRLRLLRDRLEQTSPGEMRPEIEFHAEVTDIFNALRDLHTGYRLPHPFGTKVAWLPFLIEEVNDRGRRRYILTKWVAGQWPEKAMEGAEVTHWNGMPIAQAVARNADRNAGSNPDARRARGLNTLTIRPLSRTLPPDEDWVTLSWLDDHKRSHEFVQEWLVFEPGTSDAIGPSGLVAESSALGLDDHTDDTQEARKILFAPKVARAEQAASGQFTARAVRDEKADRASQMPGVFRAKTVRRSDTGNRGTAYGYVRIFTFHVPDADAFVGEFVSLVTDMPAEGLIIDVRGNGGGLIYAAEQLLEVLTPKEIEPERAQFINTPLNLSICRAHSRSTSVRGLMLEPWVESMALSLRTGATYSLGFPITPDEAMNKVGQRYHGPVVLVTDPLCYSATDMFAAGFQDHRIGKVIGVGGRTGAGGANVWSHALLRRLAESFDVASGPSPYVALPRGADMRVAIRRTLRAKEHSGDILEDLGVQPDIDYEMTYDDVMGSNQGLIDRAIDVLASETPRSIRVTKVQRHLDRAPTVSVATSNVTRLDADVEGRRLATRDVSRNRARFELSEVLSPDYRGIASLIIYGYEGDELVAEHREDVQID